MIEYYVARDDYIEKEHRFGSFKLDFYDNLKDIIYIQYKIQLRHMFSKDELKLLAEFKKLLQT